MNLRRINGVLLLCNFVLLLVLLWLWRAFFVDVYRETYRYDVPAEVVATTTVAMPSPVVSSTSPVVSQQPVQASRESVQPSRVNWSVPFMVQAPHADWSLPYQEACEEASALMASAYVRGEPALWSPEQADLEIQKLVAWQQRTFGYYEDTSVAEVERILHEYFDIQNTRVIEDSTPRMLREELMLGNIILMPAYGKELPNPYFRNGGPLYHMLVIKGYTEDGFITNDPGTRHGQDFFYTDEALLNANHDWNGGDVEQGAKRMIVVAR